MTKKSLHPSVGQFKEFVKANPNIVKEVRNGNATWQELFEDWYLLGEDDPRWDAYKGPESGKKSKLEKTSNSDWLSNIMTTVKKMDSNQIQGHIHNINQALGAIQGVISQFQGGSQSQTPTNTPSAPQHPFQFRKD